MVVSDNPVSRAIVAMAEVVGRPATLVAHDEGGRAVAVVAELGLGGSDALVLCDHDAPDADPLLRAGIESRVGYVAMLASRGRTARVLEELRSEGYDDEALSGVHLPAGLNVGGKSPGEMALSILAEVVAVAHGRPGGPLRAPRD